MDSHTNELVPESPTFPLTLQKRNAPRAQKKQKFSCHGHPAKCRTKSPGRHSWADQSFEAGGTKALRWAWITLEVSWITVEGMQGIDTIPSHLSTKKFLVWETHPTSPCLMHQCHFRWQGIVCGHKTAIRHFGQQTRVEDLPEKHGPRLPLAHETHEWLLT